MSLWDLICAQHGRSGSRRRKRHPFPIGRIGGDVEEARQGARRLPEGRMFGHVLHQIAVHENAPVFGASVTLRLCRGQAAVDDDGLPGD